HREPGEIAWYDFGADVVVESTGQYRDRSDLQKHIDMGADRVVLTTPPRDEIDDLYIRGVSPEPIDRSHRIWSCGSSTGNCTAAMLGVLDAAFGVRSGFFTSVHAYTTEQSLIDSPSAVDLRLSRAAIENIVPVQSYTQTLIERAFPKLQGKFTGNKLNVPVPDASCVDLVTTLDTDVTVTDVNEVFRSASGSSMRDIVSFANEPIVSSDAVGQSASCVFDSLATMVVGDNMVKTLGWYDQGGGLAHRVCDLIEKFVPHSTSAR
ncbi:MAG: type I glyceraldehyde-3-phosphate dehydrogenase, partial [Planctomycetota bacterium]